MDDGSVVGQEAADRYVDALARDWRSIAAQMPAMDVALCDFADKVTKAPQLVGEDDIQALRVAGLSDRAVHDATQIVAYFNYINRVADALGVEPEDFIRPWGTMFPEDLG